jgi:hypothetical protein
VLAPWTGEGRRRPSAALRVSRRSKGAGIVVLLLPTGTTPSTRAHRVTVRCRFMASAEGKDADTFPCSSRPTHPPCHLRLSPAMVPMRLPLKRVSTPAVQPLPLRKLFRQLPPAAVENWRRGGRLVACSSASHLAVRACSSVVPASPSTPAAPPPTSPSVPAASSRKRCASRLAGFGPGEVTAPAAELRGRPEPRIPLHRGEPPPPRVRATSSTLEELEHQLTVAAGRPKEEEEGHAFVCHRGGCLPAVNACRRSRSRSPAGALLTACR